MASATVVKTFVADLPIFNAGTSPFQSGNHVAAFSVGTPTIYGANRPANSSATKYALFRQTISGNKAFALPSGSAPITTVSTATQLRVVGILAGVIKKRGSGAAVAAASTFIVAAGGGTAAGQTDLTTKAATAYAVGVTSVDVKEASGTGTILVGDKINFAGDTTDYFATATTATLDATGVAIAITPPLQVAIASAGVAVTVTAADGKTAIFADAAAVGQDVEVWILDSTDIVTVATLVASTPADVVAYDAMIASAAATISPLAKA